MNLYYNKQEKTKLVLVDVTDSKMEEYEGYDTEFYQCIVYIIVESGVSRKKADLFSSFFEGSKDQEKERTFFLKVDSLDEDLKKNIIKRVYII